MDQIHEFWFEILILISRWRLLFAGSYHFSKDWYCSFSMNPLLLRESKIELIWRKIASLSTKLVLSNTWWIIILVKIYVFSLLRVLHLISLKEKRNISSLDFQAKQKVFDGWQGIKISLKDSHLGPFLVEKLEDISKG